MTRRVAVIAPHADDEVLGVGGTIARFAAEGDEVTVIVVSRGYPPDFPEDVEHRTDAEAAEAHRLLGVRETVFLGLPSAALDTLEHRELNARLGDAIARVAPDVTFIPFSGDIHLDHQQVALSTLIALRPTGEGRRRTIYAYETLSETNWSVPYLMPNFAPTVFIDITAYLDRKIAAMETYATQIRPFPHARSAEALRALAALRGSTVGCAAAEAFVLIRAEI